MAGVVRGVVVVVLLTVFAVVNVVTLEEKLSSDEDKTGNNLVEDAANPEDLADKTANDYNDNDGVTPQEEAKGI